MCIRDSSQTGDLPDFGQVDELRVWFRSWSEDDLTKSFARVDPSSQVTDLGEKFFKKDDDNWYEHGFSLRPVTLPVGAYIFTFGSGDDGTIFDVGVASIL